MPSIVGRALLIDKLVIDPHTSLDPFKMSASTRPVVAGDHFTLGDELILQISLNIFCFLNEN